MSINNNRMKWWGKFHNKDVNQEVDRNTAQLRDLLRAVLVPMLHAKVDTLNIDKVLSNIVRKVREKYSEQEIHDHVSQYIPESHKHEEGIDD